MPVWASVLPFCSVGAYGFPTSLAMAMVALDVFHGARLADVTRTSRSSFEGPYRSSRLISRSDDDEAAVAPELAEPA